MTESWCQKRPPATRATRQTWAVGIADYRVLELHEDLTAPGPVLESRVELAARALTG